jgi:hypothetical protein
VEKRRRRGANNSVFPTAGRVIVGYAAEVTSDGVIGSTRVDS